MDTEVGSHSLLQGIFLTEGLNLDLLQGYTCLIPSYRLALCGTWTNISFKEDVVEQKRLFAHPYHWVQWSLSAVAVDPSHDYLRLPDQATQLLCHPRRRLSVEDPDWLPDTVLNHERGETVGKCSFLAPAWDPVLWVHVEDSQFLRGAGCQSTCPVFTLTWRLPGILS